MKFKDYSLPETQLDEIVAEVEEHPDAAAMDVDDDSALRKQSVVTAVENLKLTDNSGLAHKGTLSACLDFFYQIQESTGAADTCERIAAAWEEDANVTLRLIFQLRDIRKGKGIRNPFLYCLVWLRHHHFRTLLCNLEHVAEVGCWKDLVELLVVEVMGVEGYEERIASEKRRAPSVRCWAKMKKQKDTPVQGPKAHPQRVFDPKAKIDKQKVAEAAKTVFSENVEYRQLHVRVASLFATALKKDLASMKEKKGVSLACKWAPTASKHHDKFTLVVSTISQLLFPQKEHRKEGSSYSAYVSAARNMYRKQYLTPLRKYSKVTEVFMSENRWGEIPYERVASRCMKRMKGTFAERDKDRYETYLGDVDSGKKTIKSSALNPHELVEEVFGGNEKNLEDSELATIQLQWDAYIKKMKECGTLSNCMSVCDVSGSMTGLPMVVAIALSLLVANVAEEPYKGVICTFSATPELFKVPDAKLDVQVDAVGGMNWGMNTDVEKVFDLILERAVQSNIPREAMIRRLFIFSDMQFSQASRGAKTNFEAVKEKFNEAGYDLPQIVFWNLYGGGNESAPVVKHEQDTALISGYSGQLLKLFMEGATDSFDPVTILMEAIKSYTYLKVVD